MVAPCGSVAKKERKGISFFVVNVSLTVHVLGSLMCVKCSYCNPNSTLVQQHKTWRTVGFRDGVLSKMLLGRLRVVPSTPRADGCEQDVVVVGLPPIARK